MYVYTTLYCVYIIYQQLWVGWDTAGTESFRSITRSYYRGAAGCLLVYDVTSRNSASSLPYSTHVVINICFPGFTNARSWLADIREHADPHLTCILVGNKVDLVSESSGEGAAGSGHGHGHGRHREVPTDEAEIWAKEEGLLFVEASAKSGQNVELAFEQASRDILDKIRRGVFEDDRV